jgi:predicted cobalt transporter CbtA
MVGALLLRGMLVGLVAGILGFGFLKIAGELPVERSIAFESQSETTATDAKAEPEPALVSRNVQAGIGLFTGVAVYSAAVGGLFALAFALAYGRLGDVGPRATAALLATAGFVAVYLVPTLKYPADPPAVGAPDTIGLRTALYFSMIALSLAGIIAAGMLRARLQPRFGGWNAAMIAGAAYLAAMVIVGLALPAVNEVPENFPAIVLWQFRMASMGGQMILWATLGLAFGAAAERVPGGSRARLMAR